VPPRGAKERRPPPLRTSLLLDERSVGATRAAMAIVEVAPKARIAVHRHLVSAEILYVLEGKGRILAPGAPPGKLEPGVAVYIRAGAAHALDETSPQKGMKLLQIYAPPGPERVLRDRTLSGGTEVVQGTPSPEKNPFSLVRAADVAPLTIMNGRGRVRLALEPSRTGDEAAYLGVIEAEAGAEVPTHSHAGAAELLFVLSGSGEMVIGGQKAPVVVGMAVHVPEDVPHSATFTEKLRAVQLYAPAGPEQRFKAK
jgi:quercetin dioxygenase-like cupin family protein